MHRGFLRLAVLLGALAVVLGAFAAHALKGMVSDRAIATFETGVRYQFYHVFALLAAAAFYKDYRSLSMLWACRLFAVGIFLFSGSLYLLAVLQATVKPGYTWVGAITPVGGIAFIAGWILMLIAFFRRAIMRHE